VLNKGGAIVEDMILVTDWEEADEDDFYLSNEWLDEIGSKAHQRQLKKMAKDGDLFIGYEVPAVSYAIYSQMDARQVFIGEDGDVLLNCENAIIGDNHKDRWEISY